MEDHGAGVRSGMVLQTARGNSQNQAQVKNTLHRLGAEQQDVGSCVEDGRHANLMEMCIKPKSRDVN